MALRQMLHAGQSDEEADRLAEPNVLGPPLLDDPFREGLGLDPEFGEDAGAHSAPIARRRSSSVILPCSAISLRTSLARA